jgi:hypothetical protein
MNGHNLLANKMKKKEIQYETLDNSFSFISDPEYAQKLSDRINPEDIHKALDAFASRYCPVAEEFGYSYTWTIMQIECATDIVFHSPDYLRPVYDEIIKRAIFSVSRITSQRFSERRSHITAGKKSARIITSVSSEQGSNTIWVMYQ